jgi:hypothetical protein
MVSGAAILRLRTERQPAPGLWRHGFVATNH